MSDVPLRLIIDSCLTPTAIPRLLKASGDRVDPVHLDQVLPLESTDADVVAWAIAERRLVITANGADFLALLRHVPNIRGWDWSSSRTRATDRCAPFAAWLVRWCGGWKQAVSSVAAFSCGLVPIGSSFAAERDPMLFAGERHSEQCPICELMPGWFRCSDRLSCSTVSGLIAGIVKALGDKCRISASA